ncbi:MAG: pentapeptide repeat-containing protein, partial [Proteobacteria bacterium]|nr:pentapeptide repeat-containing protein [Pseudomonadota bacterium]
MSEEVDDGIKRKPAEYNPWHRFLLKSLELDGEEYPRGWHWFWGIYGLHKDKHELIKINLEKIQEKLHLDHWLNQLNRRDKSTISQTEDHDSKDKATSVLSEFLQEYDNLETSYTITFSRLTFEPEIDFSNLVFPLKVSFEYSDMPYNSKFINTYFCENANFNNAIFVGDTDFKDATFLTTAIFNNVKFKGRPLFINTKFFDFATFNDAQFFNVAFFENVKFYLDVTFNNVTFYLGVLFTGAQFSESADFTNTKFQGSTAKFRNTVFKRIADFTNARFEAYANFKGSKFGGRTSFQKTIFKHHAPRFYGAEFNNEMTFFGMIPPKLEKDEKESETAYKKRIGENQNSYENTAILLEERKKYHDQHFFFRQEMQCRRLTDRKAPIRFSFWLYEKLANYGYGIERAALFWALHIFIGFLVITFIAMCGGIKYHESVSCAISVSFANANPYAFFG